MVKFKDFSRPLSVFQVLFKANLFSKDFSRQSCIYSSTFQACANPSKAENGRYQYETAQVNMLLMTVQPSKALGSLYYMSSAVFFSSKFISGTL